MFFSVNELELRKVSFDAAFAPGVIDFGEPGVEQLSPIEARGSAELASVIDEIRVRGELRGRFSAVCDRCLEPVPIQVEDRFDLVYLPAGAEGGPSEEHALREQDTDVGFYEGAGIELRDVVREQVLLLLPMHRLCRPDCKGICPQCGGNRNEAACGCKEKPADARWAALKNLSGV